MTRRSSLVAAAVVAGSLFAVFDSAPASAHGVGARGDLPLPVWLFAYGAGGALLVSFAALGVFWPRARFQDGASGVKLPAFVESVARAAAPVVRGVGLAAFVLVFVAASWGEPDAASNFAPTAIYVVFWVGLQVLSVLVGDVWRVLSPFDTLAAIGASIRARLAPDRPSEGRAAPEWGYWPAAFLLLAFVWLELVYVDPSSPRALAVALGSYTAVVLAGAARWGRGWLRQGEAFAVWFGLLARMASLYRDERGSLRVRPPLVGLVDLRVVPGTIAMLLVALGSTSFDGLARTRLWGDLVGTRTGWEAVPVNTLGLLWMIAVVGVAYLASMRIAARLLDRDPDQLADWFAHSLLPIAFAYVVAHYFSLLVFEGQTAVALLSDPLGRGWDLFGTADWVTNFTLVSAGAIAWVQAGAIVVGHVAGVVMAHDRAVGRLPASLAVRSQYPLLGAMVLYSVGGLALLMGA